MTLRMSIPVAENRSVLLMHGSENQRKAIRPIKDFLESSSRPFLELTFKRKLLAGSTSGARRKFILNFDLIVDYEKNQIR